MIEIRGFGKEYDGFTAVENLDLNIAKGETCLLYTSPSPRD